MFIGKTLKQEQVRRPAITLNFYNPREMDKDFYDGYL